MRIRRLGVLGIALCAALTAAPTPSARVVEVRVGNHPTYTRVVFELDGRSGYRIEKSASELVVTLDAESGAREITTRSPLVAGVSVEPGERGAVARVRLRRATPLVKEMLLANPNRIVLDLMLPEELAAKPAAKPAAAKPAAAPALKAEVAAQTEPPPRPVAPEPPPKPPVAVKPPAPAAEPVVAVKPLAPAPAVVPKPAEPAKPVEVAKAPEQVVPKPVEKAPEPAKPPATAAPLDAVEPPDVATPPVAVVPPAVEKPAEPWKPPGTVETPAPPVKQPAPVPAPAPVREPQGLFGLEWGGSPPLLTLGLVAAAALVFVGVVVRVLRRRSHETPREAGAPPLVRDEEDDGAMGGFERMTQAAGRTAEPSLPVAGPGLFDDDAEKESEMEMGGGLSIEREPMTRPAAMPMDASGGSELDSLVRQLEKRLGQLETRLDEATAARERLERQVAAQSEELRVQRAAIARTQRALRGMTRGSEEQATEPALRDPSKPSPGRGSA